ncbi:MAG: hypothetical protein ACPGUU_09820 [Flavobacteriaceae bacterium]
MFKKVIFFCTVILLLGCSNSGNQNNCFPFINVSETINLDLPQYINLRIPGNWQYVPGGHQGIIIYNLNGEQFKAFDRLCPGENLDACSQLVVENNVRMKCPCNDKEYNILNGAPLTSGEECFAKEYVVENLNGTVLRITNI